MSDIRVAKLSTPTVEEDSSCQSIRECVLGAMSRYFACLDGNETANLHSMVMGEVEIALFESVMRQAGGNQTKAAQMLGISRGTLRKKLIQYALEEL